MCTSRKKKQLSDFQCVAPMTHCIVHLYYIVFYTYLYTALPHNVTIKNLSEFYSDTDPKIQFLYLKKRLTISRFYISNRKLAIVFKTQITSLCKASVFSQYFLFLILNDRLIVLINIFLCRRNQTSIVINYT